MFVPPLGRTNFACKQGLFSNGSTTNSASSSSNTLSISERIPYGAEGLSPILGIILFVITIVKKPWNLSWPKQLIILVAAIIAATIICCAAFFLFDLSADSLGPVNPVFLGILLGSAASSYSTLCATNALSVYDLKHAGPAPGRRQRGT